MRGETLVKYLSCLVLSIKFRANEQTEINNSMIALSYLSNVEGTRQNNFPIF